MKTSDLICLLVLSSIVILFRFSCDDSQDEIQTQLDSVEFRLVVLDENDIEKSIFDLGTDVRLVLMCTLLKCKTAF